MRLGDGNGVDVVSALKKRRPEAHGVVLTGYGNIATAVNAVKLGAIDYLAKPADADDVVNALLAIEGRTAVPPENPMSADRVRWEHIQRVYELCNRNVSETARRLNMPKRALRRRGRLDLSLLDRLRVRAIRHRDHRRRADDYRLRLVLLLHLRLIRRIRLLILRLALLGRRHRSNHRPARGRRNERRHRD